RGVEQESITEAQAADFHAAGYNTILTSVNVQSTNLWKSADRLGFLMIGRVTNRKGIALAGDLRHRPSCLGWLVNTTFLADEFLRTGAELVLSAEGTLVGAEMHKPPL